MTMKGDAQKAGSVFSEFGMARVLNFPLSRSRQWEDMEGHSEMTYPRSVLTWGAWQVQQKEAFCSVPLDMWVERDVTCLRERDRQGSLLGRDQNASAKEFMSGHLSPRGQ